MKVFQFWSILCMKCADKLFIHIPSVFINLAPVKTYREKLTQIDSPSFFPSVLTTTPPPPPPKPPKPSRPIEKSNHTPHTSYGCSLISHIVSLKLQLSNILLFKLKHSKLATTILYPKSGKKINRFFSPM